MTAAKIADDADPRSASPQWPRAAASCVVLRGDHVLLVERGKGYGRGVWSLPGGHIEPGERARETARREVAEETGVEVAVQGLVDVHDVIWKNGDGGIAGHYVLAVYWGRHIRGEAIAASDAANAAFEPFAGLGRLNLTAGALRLIGRARELAGIATPAADGLATATTLPNISR